MIRCKPLAAAIAAAFVMSSAIAAERMPLSWNAQLKSADEIAATSLGKLDFTRIAEEDAARAVAGQPHRFAIKQQTAVDVHAGGTWERRGDRSIWRYRVKSASAASLNFGFSTYQLPPSASLYFYDAKRKQVVGPYGANKNKHGVFYSPIVPSNDVIVELDVATAEKNQVRLVLGSINQGYRGLGGGAGLKDYRQPDLGQPKLGKAACSPNEVLSGRCQMDVACLDADDPWNKPRRSVAALTLDGSDDCTGSLVNNTAGDRRMLLITADHCGLTQSSSATVVAYWNYEWPTCRTPGSTQSGQSQPPDSNMSSSGATFLAATRNPFFSGCTSTEGERCTDNTLVELDDPPNPDFNLYWEGWDRRTIGAVCSQSGSDPASTAGLCASIHHPNVDEKRITFIARDLESVGYAGGTDPANIPVSHWHAFWDPTPPVLPGIVNPPATIPPGTTEPGSSGSPLFTSEQRLVGVLSGGPSACGSTGDDLSDFYGQLALAWEGNGTPATRLKDYLDPGNTGVEFLDGLDGEGVIDDRIFCDGFDGIPCGPSTPPTLTKAFAPTTVATGAPSTLTITLENDNTAVATLTANLVDTLPSGLVVDATPNAATTCASGTVTANAGAGTVTLASGAGIPASGNCTVTVAVSSATDGTYQNTIPAGGLETNFGSNEDAAVASLTVGTNPSDIFDSGIINLNVPQTFDGLYLNWISGDTCTSACTGTDFNFNAYAVNDGTDSLHFFWPNNASGNEAGVGDGDIVYSILGSGDTIGPDSTYTLAGGTADTSNWQAGVDGYLGFKFDCSALPTPPAGDVCFGYAHLTTTATVGFPTTIVQYWFDRSGAAITIP